MEIDRESGLPIGIVGKWAEEKHARLRKYVDISRATRRKYLGPRGSGATYIDLFCGPGVARVRETSRVIDGSPLVAWRAAKEKGVPFSTVYIGDQNEELVDACRQRMEGLGAPVSAHVGPASQTVHEVTRALDPSGLHFAFIDPFSLGALEYPTIARLAAFKRMDLLIHVSAQDLQRNLDLNIGQRSRSLDEFAPGWRGAVDLKQPSREIRRQVFDHWRELVRNLGMLPADRVEAVRGTKNQLLYWLVFAARHDLAHKFWEEIRRAGSQYEIRF